MPALRASRPDPWTTLKDTVGSIAGTGGSLFLRKGLVAAQVALSFLLLFGAGLFVRSLQNLKTADTGVALDNLVTFQLSPALSGYDDRARGDVLRAAARPPARGAGREVGRRSPRCRSSAGDEWDSSMSVEGHKAKDGEDMQAFMNAALAGLLRRRWGSRCSKGATSTRDATSKRERGDVAIVNRQFAEHFFPARARSAGTSAAAPGRRPKLNIEIVGVVADALYEGPREGVHRQVFVPNWGKGGVDVLRAHARRRRPRPTTLIRNEVRKLDASMPVYEMKTLEAQLDETLLTDRLIALLSAGFGLLATLLASIGLYGVMAFVVARRRKELGIRLALGAQPRRRHLAGDEGGAAAAGDRPRGRHSGRAGARAGSSRRSSTASRRAIRGSRSRP